MPDYYAKDGSPLELMDWAAAMEGDDRQVADDSVDDVRVSTVWLGLNHNFNPDGPPLIFETMVFGGDDDGWQDRYSTEAQARAGHTKVVATLICGERLP